MVPSRSACDSAARADHPRRRYRYVSVRQRMIEMDDSRDSQVVRAEEEEMKVWGYQRDRRRTVLTWLAICLTGFLLRIVFHWRPDWFLRATHRRCSLRRAERVLVRDQYKHLWVHRVHLSTRDGTEVKLVRPYLWQRMFNSPRTEAYQMESNFQDDSLLRYYTNKKIKFLWNWDLDCFERIKTLDEDLAGCLHSMPHLSHREAARRRVMFGSNVIDVPITPLIKVLLLQALHPFYVFQVFSCILWYFDEYWQYATCIVIVSIISLSLTVFETRRNERSLRNTISTQGQAMVQREGEFWEMPAELLVPGDIVEIPRSGCEMFCDVGLICGNAIVNESMLTGESVPVSKVPFPLADEEEVEGRRNIDLKSNSRHVLFCGTRVIQARNYEGERVRGVVLRTGFSTAKGELVRAIMFPKPLRHKFDRDIIHYLYVLCSFAFIGFIYTIVTMISYKKPAHLIVLRALDLITVIVPPALPAAMSVGLVFSLRRLKTNRIFCIAPRTINASGGLDLIAFDKTGTLTEEGLDLRRLLYRDASSGRLVEESDPRLVSTSHPVIWCMAASHALAHIDGSLCGDPVDLKMFQSIGWRLEEPQAGGTGDGEGDTVEQMVPRVVTSDGGDRSIGLLREFPFSSSLQRMAVLGRVLGDSHFSLFVKGAPEVVRGLCKPETVPADLEATLAQFTHRGYRVLALAWRQMGKLSVVRVHRVAREEVEQDLTFLGLLMMENRLKPESMPTIARLRKANLRVVMVTGDNLLTALSVARDCGIVLGEDRIVSVTTDNSEAGDRMEVIYREVYETSKAAVSDGDASPGDVLLDPRAFRRNHSQPMHEPSIYLALTGSVWADIRQHRPDLLPKIVVRGAVFARFSPEQKAQLVQQLQEVGYSVGMCGDGANDCGALKAAHTGISLSEAEASVASPFTSKRQDVSCVPALIREGRCALVTSFGIFKYMAGYSLTQFTSVLTLYHLKLNLTDGQFLYVDLIIITSLSITFGYTRPARNLHPTPPPNRLITMPTILSIILLQGVNAGVQVGALLLVKNQNWFQVRNELKAVEDEDYHSYENTVLFIASAFQYIILAVVFAKGAPYRRHIFSNVFFLANLLILSALTFYIALDPFPELRDWLEMTNTPNSRNSLMFRALLVGMATANFFLCAILEGAVDSVRFRRLLDRLSRRLCRSKRVKHWLIDDALRRGGWPLTEMERQRQASVLLGDVDVDEGKGKEEDDYVLSRL